MKIRKCTIILQSALKLMALALLATCLSTSRPVLGADAPEFHLSLLASDPAGGGDAAISPDGKYFVTSSHRSGAWDLWMYEIASHRWTQLTHNQGDNMEAQWSPNGEQLAFNSTRTGNKDIWLLDLKTGKQTQVTNAPDDDEYPAWSPDGKDIVYTGGPWGQRDFFVVSASGGPPRKVTRQPGMAGACSFMPEGDAVICHDYNLGAGNISILPLSGAADPVAVTRGSAWDYKPAVCPRGGWVAFSRTNEGPTTIWLKQLNGDGLVPLTTTVSEDRWPTWNASGDKLLFHRLVDYGTAIKVLDRKTREAKTIVGPEEKPEQASLDPRGDQVVYTTEVDNQRQLRVRNIRTGQANTLKIAQASEVAFPRWSPDAKRIALLAKQDDRWEVATINADGTGFNIWTRAHTELHGMRGLLDWSPDGKKIVFHADTRPFEANLYILDLESGKIQNITPDAWFDEAPSWTPDGKGILFMSTRGGNWTWGLFRLSLADRKIQPVTTPDYVEKDFPRMGKDQSMVWSEFDGDGIEHVLEKSRDGHAQRVDQFGPGARWPSFSADGRFMLATTTVRKVEYWMAENMFSAGSPLLTQKNNTRATVERPAANALMASVRPRLVPATLERSPVHPYHR
jgi:TolB protein